MYNFADGGGTASPIVVNTAFIGNVSFLDGGAVANLAGDGSTSTPDFNNVLFSGNSANNGGGMVNVGMDGGRIFPTLTNVTIAGNSASENGGGMANAAYNGGSSSNPTFRNSILWNNLDMSGSGTISATVYNFDASAGFLYSLVQGSGGTSNWILDPRYIDIGDNIDVDPTFISPVDPSSAPTTAGNYRLKHGSPAIDAGADIYISAILTDLDGNGRIADGNNDGTAVVDMGAYEVQIVSYLPVILR